MLPITVDNANNSEYNTQRFKKVVKVGKKFTVIALQVL